MKIAYLVAGVPLRGPSGASAHARGLFAALAKQGEARLFAVREHDRRGAVAPPIPGVYTGVPGWPSYLRRWEELREIRAGRRLGERLIEEADRGWLPDRIIERHSLFSDAGLRAAEALGRPLLLEVNAPLCAERARYEALPHPAWAARWERTVLRGASRIAAVSRWLVRWLREEIGCADVIWVPNGTDLPPGDRARGRAALGLGADEPAIAFLGSMRPYHGVERCLPVAQALGARLVLLGPPQPGIEALQPGWLLGQALADALAAVDLALAPYPATAPPWFCPLKLLDYRSQGTPIVATDVGDCAALIGPEDLLVPPDDAGALIEAARRRIGQRSAPFVRSWATVAAEMLATPEKAFGGAPAIR